MLKNALDSIFRNNFDKNTAMKSVIIVEKHSNLKWDLCGFVFPESELASRLIFPISCFRRLQLYSSKLPLDYFSFCHAHFGSVMAETTIFSQFWLVEAQVRDVIFENKVAIFLFLYKIWSKMALNGDNIPLADEDTQVIIRDEDDPKMRIPSGKSMDSLQSSYSTTPDISMENDGPDEKEEKTRLITQVLELQNTLDDLSQRVDSVKEENLKLRSENQVLAQYIENLMSASSVFQSTNIPNGKKK